MTTVPKQELGKSIAKLLLKQKLAACIQMIPISSMYTWNDAMVADSEYLLLIKTQSGFFGAIKDCIASNHPYKVPEIIETPITNGSTSYLEWIINVTKDNKS